MVLHHFTPHYILHVKRVYMKSLSSFKIRCTKVCNSWSARCYVNSVEHSTSCEVVFPLTVLFGEVLVYCSKCIFSSETVKCSSIETLNGHHSNRYQNTVQSWQISYQVFGNWHSKNVPTQAFLVCCSCSLPPPPAVLPLDSNLIRLQEWLCMWFSRLTSPNCIPDFISIVWELS